MRKIVFYISLVISIILLINIIKILTTDLDRLTEYGFGYLAGKVILFIIFTFIIYITRKHKIDYKSEQ
jgi:hypothetical protein